MSNSQQTPTDEQVERSKAALHLMGQAITEALEISRPKDLPKVGHIVILFPISDPKCTAMNWSPGVSRATLVKVLEGQALTVQTTMEPAGRA